MPVSSTRVNPHPPNTQGGKIPIVVDTSPCLSQIKAGISEPGLRFALYEPVEFIRHFLVDKLEFNKVSRRRRGGGVLADPKGQGVGWGGVGGHSTTPPAGLFGVWRGGAAVGVLPLVRSSLGRSCAKVPFVPYHHPHSLVIS